MTLAPLGTSLVLQVNLQNAGRWHVDCFDILVLTLVCLEQLQEAPDSKAPAGKQAKTAPKKGPAKGSKKK